MARWARPRIESGQEGRKEFLCFLLSLSQKRRKGWDQETEIDREGNMENQMEERE